MSVKDVIKSSVYDRLGGGTGLSLEAIALVLLVAVLIGVYLFFLYKVTSKKSFYSKDLATTIAGAPVIIAAIMIAMQSNLLVSLGMVGALSIVRFRTAIKNPLDLLYLFLSISAGIISGVGLFLLALVLVVIMTVLILGLACVANNKANSALILRTKNKVDWDEVSKIISSNSKYFKEKSRNIKNETTEVIFEIRAEDERSLVDALDTMKQFELINVLTCDGEIRC